MKFEQHSLQLCIIMNPCHWTGHGRGSFVARASQFPSRLEWYYLSLLLYFRTSPQLFYKAVIDNASLVMVYLNEKIYVYLHEITIQIFLIALSFVIWPLLIIWIWRSGHAVSGSLFSWKNQVPLKLPICKISYRIIFRKSISLFILKRGENFLTHIK